MSTKGAALIIVRLSLVASGILRYLGRGGGSLLGSCQDDGGGTYRGASPQANRIAAGD